MIGFLKGKVINTGKNNLTILTGDSVGYKVNIPSSIKFLIDQDASLYIHTLVKENEISLWGFEDEKELNLFELLISVSGVGAKTANILIESKGFDNIVNSIVSGNSDSLKVTGVGPKTAQKIIIDLKSKIANLASNSAAIENSIKPSSKISIYFEDAMAALTSLGYKEQDVKAAYNLIDSELIDSLSDSSSLVKLLLKNI
jgi:holliday junction DNA helicase RuvA